MYYDFTCLIVGKMFIKLLFEWRWRNAVDGSAMHGADSTEDSLEVLGPVNEDGGIVNEEVLSIRTV